MTGYDATNPLPWCAPLRDAEGGQDVSDMFWIDHATEPVLGAQIGGAVLVNVHPPQRCAGQACAMHNPSDHHMRDWPTDWRGDTKLMERLCPHGVGHPDPDSAAWHERQGRAWVGVHGCDGCCRAER